MKILLDARLYGLENAGLGRYTINLIRELGKVDKKNEYVVLLRKKYYDSINLPKNWKKVLADFHHYSFAEQVLLPGLIKKEKPDITHFLHFNVPIFFSGKFIVTIHDMLMHDFAGLSATTLPGPLYFIKQFAYSLVFRKAALSSSKIIVPSDTVKEEIKKYYKLNDSKLQTIYEGVDEKIFAGVDKKIGSPYFVYAGNAYPHKNLTRLVEAIIMLNKNRDEKILLVIASARNVFIKRLERMVANLNANDLVKLLGFVADVELGSLYKNSLGFVFPSLSEGFGLPGLEAMNSGTLLLASEIPVFKEIYDNNAIYFNPFDFSSIEKAMENVLEMGDTLRRDKILASQKFSKRYSWAKMAGETLKIYENTFKEGGNSIRQGK